MRIQKILVRCLPIVTYHVVPFLQGISIGRQVVMLAPSLKDHEGFETIGQGLLQLGENSFLIWRNVQPLEVKVRGIQFPYFWLLGDHIALVIILLLIIIFFFLPVFSFFALFFLGLKLVMNSGIKFPVLTLAMWGEQERLRALLYNRTC